MNNILTVTSSFGRNHIITLIVCLVLITLGIIWVSKSKITFNQVLNIMLVFWVLSEIIKLCSNMSYLLSDGSTVKIIKYQATAGIEIVRAFYPRGELPLHLCSIQPIFMLIVKFSNNDKIKSTLLGFMAPTGIIGAIIALAVDTVGCDFTNPQVYEYFIYHMALVIFASSIISKKQITITWKSNFKTLMMLLIMFIGSIWVNTLCSDNGVNPGNINDSVFYTNFFYSMKPPIDGLPLLNFNHGWFGYFITIIILGMVLVTLFHLPFILINNKKIKSKEISE